MDIRKPSARNFIRALRHHWITLMSGGGLIVLLGVSERFSGYSLSRWAYGLFVASLLVISSYLSWRDERRRVNSLEKALAESQQKPLDANPVVKIQIDEAILQPVLHNGLKCFLRLTLRNLVEDAPCIIEQSTLRVRIGETWYNNCAPIDASTVQLVTYEQLHHQSEVPMNTPYHLEDSLPVIEVSREDATSLLALIGEDHPLRRGFPKAGWLGFLFSEMPVWPTRHEPTGQGRTEIDRETGQEFFVEEERVVRTTKSVQEISLTVVDGHGLCHFANRTRPFGTWSRRIEDRRPREFKMY